MTHWNYHTDFIAPKLSRALGMLMRIRHYVDANTLRSVYFGIFSSTMLYGAQIINKHVNRIIKLQDSAIRIINFAKSHDSRGQLYKNMKILKFSDNIYVSNFLFAHDNFKLPSIFDNYFMFSMNQHSYPTRAATRNLILLPETLTKVYGINSITYQSAHIWNSILREDSNKDFSNNPNSSYKKFIFKQNLDSY